MKKPIPEYQTIEQQHIIERIRQQHPNLLTDSPETIELRKKLKESAAWHRRNYPEIYRNKWRKR